VKAVRSSTPLRPAQLLMAGGGVAASLVHLVLPAAALAAEVAEAEEQSGKTLRPWRSYL
jgi:hypothetical protein